MKTFIFTLVLRTSEKTVFFFVFFLITLLLHSMKMFMVITPKWRISSVYSATNHWVEERDARSRHFVTFLRNCRFPNTRLCKVAFSHPIRSESESECLLVSNDIDVNPCVTVRG